MILGKHYYRIAAGVFDLCDGIC